MFCLSLKSLAVLLPEIKGLFTQFYSKNIEVSPLGPEVASRQVMKLFTVAWVSAHGGNEA